MTGALHEKNVHFMISIWPNMNAECDNYREFQEAGLLLPGSEIYDAFREEGGSCTGSRRRKGCSGTGSTPGGAIPANR